MSSSPTPMQVDSCIDPSTSSVLSPAPAPAARAGWRPVGWSDIPTDWLGCISEFLSLQCLSSSLLPVCRGWRDGLHSAALRAEWLMLNNDRITHLCNAPVAIRQHVLMLLTIDAIPRAVLALTHCLPRLVYLDCRIDCRSDDTETEVAMQHAQRRFQFPLWLVTLKLSLEMAVDGDATPRWIQLERVLDAASQVSTLTRLDVTLEVDGAFALIPMRTMQPLARLRESLIELTNYRNVNENITDPGLTRGHVDLIRSMHRLKLISLHGVADWSAKALEWIAAEPRMVHLREMDLGDTIISDEHAAVLTRFTWLTCLNARLEGSPIFLANLVQLTSIRLHCWSQVDPALLVSALSHCTRIERLEMTHPALTSTHLCALLPSLPLLDELTLWCMSSLTSLSFTSSAGHLSRTLQRLTIFECRSLAPDEVRHLRALTALRSLTLTRNFSGQLNDATIASMTPASQTFDRVAWPSLDTFDYYTPPETAAE